MSDTPKMGGWWQASDGKWYPPEQHPDYRPPPPPSGRRPAPPGSPVQPVPVAPVAGKNRRKWPWVLLGLVVLVIIISASGGGDDDQVTSGGRNRGGSDSRLFPGRPDVKKNDKDRQVGQPAELSGFTATVTSAGFQQQLNQFERDGYLVADVTLLNRDARAQSYNTFYWKLITPEGQIIDPAFTGADQLGSGDLVRGGSISGKLIWEVGTQRGDFYVIFDPPDVADDDRGVWKVTV
jgi:hypothetical protein